MRESSTDNMVLLPYSTALRFDGTGKPGAYVFSTASINKAQASAVKQALRDYLYSTLCDKKNYHLMAMSEMLDQTNKMMAWMSVLMGDVTDISLFIAGVGAVNIMLALVTEWIQGIGIWEALGAYPGVILRQFTLEAITTSVLGGLTGIRINSGVLNIATIFFGYSVAATPSIVLTSSIVLVVIDLLFGYMPVKRVAALNPIDALRSG